MERSQPILLFLVGCQKKKKKPKCRLAGRNSRRQKQQLQNLGTTVSAFVSGMDSVQILELKIGATSSSSLSSNLSFSQVPCQFDQSHALLQFKNSFSITSFASDDNPPYSAPYPKTDSWEEGIDCCLWDGVTCDSQTGYVIGLDLSSSMLFGTFHSNNSLFLLSHLQNLELSNNDFNHSNISSRFSEFLNLRYLNLNYSIFEGLVPLEITYLSNLVWLDISRNDLTLEATTFNRLAQNLTKLRELSLNEVNMSMAAPSSLANLSSSLLSLKLRSCYLQGNFLEYAHLSNRLVSLDLSWNDLKLQTTSFSKLLQNLTNLRELYLSYVNMSLVEPISLMNLSSSLSYLQLCNCGLQGEFPGNLLQRPNLRVLNLRRNYDLIGCLPRSNWSCSLKSLSLSYTKIAIHLEGDLIKNLRSVRILNLQACNFVGSNVTLFGNLRQLSQLSLSSNNFSGQIPPEFGNLEHLSVLDLSFNNFSGQIPLVFGNLGQLSWLDLSFNNFSGQIPLAFGNLGHLIWLDLSFNNFSGQIPFSLANLKQLFYLDLDNNNLSGAIPNSFANLAQLQYLRLSNNRLVGPIPSQLGRLSNLSYLSLSNNLLNATIPTSLFDLPHLDTLLLQRNLLTGHISQFQHNSLSYIDLSSNKLEGAIPSSVCKLKQLQVLDLSNNSFSSSIPNCLGNFSNNLLVLHLGMNNFQGSIPTSFSKGNSLRYLNFNGNQLGGRIPPSIANCKNLEVLDIGNNKIDDTFPVFLEILGQLRVLVLRSNKLHGFLKGATANYSFSKLRIVDMSSNSLSGTLPLDYFSSLEAMIAPNQNIGYMGANTSVNTYQYSVHMTWKGWGIELIKIQTVLTIIDFSANKFIGNIPWSIGKLESLIQLNLSHNYLTGNIPHLLGKLRNLESLDLSSNMLTGKIPTQLVNLIFLSVFRVSHNQLEGRIPLGKQLDTFDSSSYEGNSGLCGFPLKKACNDGERQPITPLKNVSKSENGFGWKVVLIGFVCGFVFGVTMGYLVFRMRKPIWFVKMVESRAKTCRSHRRN
ncbi:hypothetical protein GH714_011322 [Hevea brasiliensis]|uniref:Leucine-rich repeat-containing N-terminal plant-type domain-containing protein n=1 Tax=Hevea brasiliensis TaxID=3981 RepID=A0A6A6MYI0_HEVBR|nr:hypothetical protein GH714_011322 [Hevea brasiliensis]